MECILFRRDRYSSTGGQWAEDHCFPGVHILGEMEIKVADYNESIKAPEVGNRGWGSSLGSCAWVRSTTKDGYFIQPGTPF